MARSISDRRIPGLLAVCMTAALAGMSSAEASVISSTPTLPLLGVPYTATTGVGCFPLAGLCVGSGVFTLTAPVTSTFNPSGQDIVSDATFAGTLTTLGNVPIGAVFLSGTIEQEVLGRTTSTQTGSWTTDLVALSLTGPVQGDTLTLVLDTANTSAGTTSITPIGDNGFSIDSFFDVFVELTLDRPTPLHTGRGPIEVIAGAPVPVPEPAGLALLGVSLLTLSQARRRRG